MADRRIEGVHRQIGTLYRVGRLGGEPDAELLDRFLSGPEAASEAAFASLVERHGPMVLRVSRRLLPDPNDAEDAAQAAFLLLARRADSIRRRDSVASWLHGVTLRVSKKARSASSRRRLLERRAAEHSPRPPSAPEPGDALESPWADLHAELDRLPDSLRAPIVLCYLEGQTNEQAADALRVPLRTLRRRLAQGRDRLRRRLSRADAAPLAAALAELPRLPSPPLPWLDRTVRSALALSSGRLAAAPAASAVAVSLAQEVTRTMLRAQLLRSVAAAALLLGLAASGSIPLVLARQDTPPGALPPPPSQQPKEQEQAASFAEVPDVPIPGGLDRAPLPGWLTDFPHPEPGRELAVRVVSADTGEPIPNAAVRVVWNFDKEWRTADDRGLLSVRHSTGPTDRWVALDVWGDGFAMQRHSFGMKEGEAIPDEATITLHPGESLGGLVQDEQGRPVPGATVYLSSRNTAKQHPREAMWQLRATTDPDGRWRTGGAPETTGNLSNFQIVHPDYISDLDFVNGDRQPPPIEDLRAGTAVSVLEKGPYVEGRVLDADGDPVPDALVVTSKRFDTLLTTIDHFGASTVTDADGRFRTGQLRPGTWHLASRAPGLAPTSAEVEIGSAVRVVDLRLGRPRTLRFRAVDPDGDPVPGAFVNLSTSGFYRLLGIFLWTDAEGLASWDDAPDEPIGATISAPGRFRTYLETVEPTDEEVVCTLRPALTISGTVREAETNEPIESAEVEVGAVDPQTGEVPEWEGRAPDGLRTAWVDDGRLYVSIPAEADAYRLRITLPGYSPFVSRAFRAEERYVSDYDVTLEGPSPDNPIATVRMPDGTPLADARVLIARGDNGVSLRNGEADDSYAIINPGRPFRTGPDGTFAIPRAEDAFVALVIGDRGYAIATSDQLAESGEVRALPFARVEGRNLIGDRPGSNHTIELDGVLEPQFQDPDTGRVTISLSHEATTDAQGRFVFERVIPMEWLRVVRQDEQGTPNRYWIIGDPVHVEPGETSQITFGGVGRPVVGRVAPPEGWDEPVDFTVRSMAHVSTNQANTPYPPELFRGKTDLEGGDWSDWFWEWRTTPEGRAYKERSRWIAVALSPDGSFRIDDVPPGEYRLVVGVGEEEFGRQQGPFAPISRTFTVPEVPGGGYSPEPIDFETLRLRRRTTLEVGQPAPEAEVTTVEGKDLKIPDDFEGRYLLLDFGTPTNDQSRLSIARANGLHEQFGEDDRVSMLSLIVAEDDAETRDFIAAKGQPWPQAILGPLPTPVAEAYGVEDSSINMWANRLPGFVLIGPEGTILSLDTYGRELAPVLSEALGQ